MNGVSRTIACLIACAASAGCGRIGYEQITFDRSDAAQADAAVMHSDRQDGGASFDTTVAIDAASPPDDTAPGADAAINMMPVICTSPLIWQTEFDRDPAMNDSNQDGVADWAWARSPTSPPERYRNGAWYPEGVEILDTRPLRAWNTRTAVIVRMQNLATDVTEPNAWGALVWLNLNNDRPNVMAVYLSLTHNVGGGQTLHFRRRGLEADLITVQGLPDRLIDIRLDVDPIGAEADLWVDDNFIGSASIPDTATPATDPFATVATFGGPSVFDSITIVSCK